MTQLCLWIKWMHPFSQSKGKTKCQAIQLETRQPAKKMIKMWVRNKNVSWWQVWPQLETNIAAPLQQLITPESAQCLQHPLIIKQCNATMWQVEDPLLLLHDRMHQWQWSEKAFKQMVHEVTQADMYIEQVHICTVCVFLFPTCYIDIVWFHI